MLENDSSALVHETDWRYAENPDISELVYLSATVYMVIIGSFGILSNGSIILAFFRGTTEVRCPFNFLLINVVFAEFIVSIYGIPMDLTCIIMRGYKLGHDTCLATGFILTLAGMTSLYSLMGLSVERWLIITRPNKFTLNSKLTTCTVVATAWLFSLGVSVPPLIGWAYYAPETSGMSCAPAWEDPSNSGYTWFLMIFGFFLPLLVIVYTSLQVVYNLNLHSKTLASSTGRTNGNKKERRASLMVLIMISAFLFSWLPYAVVCIMKMSGYEVTPTISSLPLLFAKSSICWNPIIYVVLNEQFRSSLLPKGSMRFSLSRIQSSASKWIPSVGKMTSQDNVTQVNLTKCNGRQEKKNLGTERPEFSDKGTNIDKMKHANNKLRPANETVFKASPFRRQVKAVVFETSESGEPIVKVINSRSILETSKPSAECAAGSSIICNDLSSEPGSAALV